MKNRLIDTYTIQGKDIEIIFDTLNETEDASTIHVI